MQFATGSADTTSEDRLRREMRQVFDSGAGVAHVATREILRASVAIRKQMLSDGYRVKEWNIVSGFVDITNSTVDSHLETGDGNNDFNTAFKAPFDHLKGSAAAEKMCYVFISPHLYMDGNPWAAQLLLTYHQILPSTNCTLVLVTPDIPLPGVTDSSILRLEFLTPSQAELRESLTAIVDDVAENFPGGATLTAEGIDRICHVGAGLPRAAFDTYVSLSIVQAGDQGEEALTAERIADGVSVGKTEVVNENDILELYKPDDMRNVGGLENLKRWIRARQNCFSEEAREFGIEPPKGIVFVGVPGAGKSLSAKAVGSELGVPVVRLDFGRVFNSLVGASEQRMRTALKMVESMAPCVLFCDEIDKGLGGAGGSGDSGTSSRVLGSFLTWLNDCTAPVFTMVTANNVTGLPPEMLRRGRFDAIFSAGLPGLRSRREILRIHMEKRGRALDSFAEEEVSALLRAMDGYVGAEIESIVKDGLVAAFSRGEDLDISHLMEATSALVPLSRAFKQQIDSMAEWAKNNATPADDPEDDAKTAAPAGRVIRRGARTPGKASTH